MSEKDPAELRRRLKKLGRSRRRKQEPKRIVDTTAIALPDGDEIETDLGVAFRIESQYAVDHLHGNAKLSEVLSFPGSLAAEITKQASFEQIPLKNIAFLDTETTGLGGGAGTLVFLVGIGTFVDDQFRFRQYFLRDPGEEAGMLEVLKNDLETASGFVTFNGSSFDLPLLETRYTIALRKRLSLMKSPHLDLLHVARRLWRHALPDCTLGTVERAILGVERTEDDVPGAWIPGMYLDYLRTGDASDMTRVIYHNTIDVLSLVGVARHVLDRHTDERLTDLTASEALAVARWHQDSGRTDPAESAYKLAARTRKKTLKIEAVRRYASHLKKENRKSEAVKVWQRWHRLAPEDPAPCIELAKYYEWDVQDYANAFSWAQNALACLTHWPADWRKDQAWEEIEHRIKRLKRKIEGL